jgi:hypothetical protein
MRNIEKDIYHRVFYDISIKAKDLSTDNVFKKKLSAKTRQPAMLLSIKTFIKGKIWKT